MWNILPPLMSVIVLIVCQTIHTDSTDDDRKDTLRLVQILFRHGDRNPLSPYPNDPNDLETNWPEGYGQLTNIGKRQLYDFGVYLRSRYDDYLSKTYFAKETYVWSSDNDRTIVSAMAAMAGLYPPVVGESEWNPLTNFQLVSIHTIPKTVDRLLNTEREACPNFYNIVKNFIKTSKYMKDLNRESKDVLKYISDNSGLKITFVNDLVYRLHDTLSIQELRNMSIPEWAVPLMKQDSQFKKMVGKCYNAFSLTPQLARLYSGELLKELFNNMKDKLPGQSKSKLRLVMFSGHDLTIANLMNTMGIYNKEIPPYAASLIFELHKYPESSEYTVKILYRNDTKNKPYEMNVRDCETPCELTKLEQLLLPFISENWDEECHSKISSLAKTPESLENSANKFSSTAMLIATVMTIFSGIN